MMIATDLVNKYVRRYSQMPFVSPPNELYQRHRVSKSDLTCVASRQCTLAERLLPSG